MIISASRRTDIPALYGDWFINRLKDEYVMVRNPMNRKMISYVPLAKEHIDCIVFWTKDPANFLKHLDTIDELGHRYYFLFTITPYDKNVERNIRNKKDILNTFKSLSKRIGSDRVILRYDPIIINKKYSFDFHIKAFHHIIEELGDYTDRCIISFITQYNKIRCSINNMNIHKLELNDIEYIMYNLKIIAEQNNINIYTCAQKFDLRKIGIEHSKCIDDNLVEKIAGYRIKAKKDKSQREECLCIESKDIGKYNTCINDCIYCYANNKKTDTIENYKKYDPQAPLLCDEIIGDERILEYKNNCTMKAMDDKQKSLF